MTKTLNDVRNNTTFILEHEYHKTNAFITIFQFKTASVGRLVFFNNVAQIPIVLLSPSVVQVSCPKSGYYFSQCSHADWGVNKCTHAQDVSVECGNVNHLSIHSKYAYEILPLKIQPFIPLPFYNIFLKN